MIFSPRRSRSGAKRKFLQQTYSWCTSKETSGKTGKSSDGHVTCLVDESYYFIKRQIDINLFSFAQLTGGRFVISVSAERILKHKMFYWLVKIFFWWV